MKFPELSEDVKQRLKNCKDGDELIKLASEHGVELTDEQLEGVSGGSWATKCPKEGCDPYGTPRPEPDSKPASCYHYGMF